MPLTLGESKRSIVATIVVLLAVFMTNLDLWIVNVALPSIGSGFSSAAHPTTLADLSWVLNAYAIALGALLVVMGRLADRIGQRSVFIGGVVLFTVASVGCAIAPSLGVLVVARVLQAVGAAAQLPSSLALLLASVSTERRTAVTRSWVAVGALSASAGPVLGGLLVQIDWRWVFVVNLPIGVFAVFAGLAVLPRMATREGGRLPDLWGAVLVTGGVAALCGGLVEAPTWGWGSSRTVGLFVVFAAATLWFASRSTRHHTPLLELHLLRLPRFGTANTGTFIFGTAFAMMLLSNVLWCQEVWHWSALTTGLALVPGPAAVPIVTAATRRTVERVGQGPLIVAGGVLFGAAMLWRVCFVSLDPNYVRDLLPSMVLGGTGVGLAMGSLIAAGVHALPANRAATGSALVNSMRQISATVGVSILISILGASVGAGSVTDFRVAWVISASLGIVTATIGLQLARTRVPAGGAPAPYEAPALVTAPD